MLIQLMLIAWERLFRVFVTKWVVLVVAAGSALGIFQLGYPGGFYGFIVDNLTFNPLSGAGRMEILVYGSQTVARHPIFGIGLTGWTDRPWWRPSSVDNFWMVIAMRYGLPALALIWIGLAWHTARIVGRGGLNEQAANYRKGYLFAGAGLVFVLASVHVWDADAVLMMFYFGAGAWLYLDPAAVEPVQPRERRRPPLPAPATPATPVANRRAGGAASRRASARQDLRR
jgi:hypothetical protein